MPKQKTHRGAAKRFKLTATGKVKRESANWAHYANHKTRKRKRQLRKTAYVGNAAEAATIRKLLPYL